MPQSKPSSTYLVYAKLLRVMEILRSIGDKINELHEQVDMSDPKNPYYPDALTGVILGRLFVIDEAMRLVEWLEYHASITDLKHIQRTQKKPLIKSLSGRSFMSQLKYRSPIYQNLHEYKTIVGDQIDLLRQMHGGLIIRDELKDISDGAIPERFLKVLHFGEAEEA